MKTLKDAQNHDAVISVMVKDVLFHKDKAVETTVDQLDAQAAAVADVLLVDRIVEVEEDVIFLQEALDKTLVNAVHRETES